MQIVFYDIEDNKQRTKIAKLLLNEGLERIQYSVFVGNLEKDKFTQLWQKLKPIIDKEEGEEQTDKIYVLNISKERFKQMNTLGKPPEIDFLTGEKDVLIF